MQDTDNHNLHILQFYFNDFKIYESESQKTQTINYKFNLRFSGQYYDQEKKPIIIYSETIMLI